MSKIFLLTFMAMMIPEASSASNWIKFSESPDGRRTFLADVDSVTDPENGIVKVWVKIDYSKDPTTSIRQQMQRWEYQCRQHKSRTTSSVSYKADGSVMFSRDFPYASFDDIVPDSIGQSLETAVCQKTGNTDPA